MPNGYDLELVTLVGGPSGGQQLQVTRDTLRFTEITRDSSPLPDGVVPIRMRMTRSVYVRRTGEPVFEYIMDLPFP